MDLPSGYTLTSGGGYFLRGAQYHQRPLKVEKVPNAPYCDIYQAGRHSLYLLVGQNYQTAVSLRSLSPSKGLQSWRYQGEPPRIAPSIQIRSRIMDFGFDSCRMDSFGDDLTDSHLLTPIRDGLDVLVVPYHDKIIATIFSNDMTVVLYRHPAGEALIELAQASPVCAKIGEMGSHILRFQDSTARFFYPKILPIVEHFEDCTRIRMRFKSEFFWYAFAGPKSSVVVRPVLFGLVFVQLHELGESTNLLINLSSQPFDHTMMFPETKIPVPAVKPYGATLVKTN